MFFHFSEHDNVEGLWPSLSWEGKEIFRESNLVLRREAIANNALALVAMTGALLVCFGVFGFEGLSELVGLGLLNLAYFSYAWFRIVEWRKKDFEIYLQKREIPREASLLRVFAVKKQ